MDDGKSTLVPTKSFWIHLISVIKNAIYTTKMCKICQGHLKCSVFPSLLAVQFLTLSVFVVNAFQLSNFLLKVNVCSLYIKAYSAIEKFTRAIHIFSNLNGVGWFFRVFFVIQKKRSPVARIIKESSNFFPQNSVA